MEDLRDIILYVCLQFCKQRIMEFVSSYENDLNDIKSGGEEQMR